MKILLTGARGMVGRNLLEHRDAKNFVWYMPTRQELDLTNLHQVRSFFEKNKPDIVIHAAGLVGGIQANIRDPLGFFVENLEMGKNVLLSAKEFQVEKVVNIGSSCMYPKNRQDALKETDILTGELEPTNEGYALAKIAVARMAEYIMKDRPDWSYKTFIPCNLYGRFDKFDPRWSHLIPAIIHKIHQAKISCSKEVEIWGNGLARREFMYAGDLADTILVALTKLEQIPDLMNVGVGSDFSINEYYETAADVIGYDGKFVHDLSKPVGMIRKLTDVTRARNCDLSAKTSLRDGLKKTYDFYLENIN